MKKSVRTLVWAIIACALGTVSAYAQTEETRQTPGPDEARMARLQEDLVSFEVFHRSLTADSAEVDLLYRFRRDALVFARSPGKPLFNARAEVSIEIIDSTGASVARSIRTFSLSSEDNALASLRTRDEQGFASFRLKRGRYTALCTITDMEAEHKQYTRRIPVVVPRIRVASSSLLLARSVDSLPGIVPENLGGNALFSQPLFAVTVIPSRYEPVRAVYSLNEARMEGEESKSVRRDTAVLLRIVPSSSLVPAYDSANGVYYRLVRDPERSIAVLPLDGEKLAQATYALTLKLDASGDTSTLRSTFALRWRDMPQSLRDLDFATSAMRYITTEDEYDELASGRRSKRIEAFEAFWKKQDPTPATAYNERLAEYFRRVDHAFQTFRTLKEENGVNTDRGKIYILYGNPGGIERLFSPSNAPREVWRYPALKKQFTFEDQSRQGNYKLIQSDNQ